MSDAWEIYVEKYGKNPDSSEQLMHFSKNNGKSLNFKEAKDLFNSHSGKGKASPALNAQKPPSQPPKEKDLPKEEIKPSEEVVVEEKQEDNNNNDNANPLFAQLNQGTAITKGLNKVTKEMKTKNQPNRSGKVEEIVKPKQESKKLHEEKEKEKEIKQASISKKGFRWIAENYKDGVQSFEEADTKSEIYITNCNGGGFMISNKVKGVTIDNCNKIQVEVHEVVSTIELINCKGVTVFVKKTAPSIHVDKCQQPKLVIFQEALDKNPSIITSMVQDFNIEVPPESDECDAVEIAIPYQFTTTIDPKTKKAVTTPVEHSG